jgi:hypothetical protein
VGIEWRLTQPAHLTENHLLTAEKRLLALLPILTYSYSRLRSNGLRQKLRRFATVEMVDESPDATFTETSNALHEINPYIGLI